MSFQTSPYCFFFARGWVRKGLPLEKYKDQKSIMIISRVIIIYLQKTNKPEWMKKGKTYLIQKGPQKWNYPKNYRPITCLPAICKLLMTQIKEAIYDSLISWGLFNSAQKRCRKVTREKRELRYIDQYILRDSKNETEKSRYSVDWQRKGIRCSPSKLDNRLP